ncbi:histidine kinase [Nostoc ellipsosporum NOK]|nr:histidine kinase [Nostoc ellipsosporum NOK]
MKKTVALHAFLWIIYGVLEYQAYPDVRVLEMNIFFFLRMLLYVALFYFNALFLYDRLFKKKKALSGVVLLLVSLGVFYLLLSLLFQHFYFEVYEERLRGLKNIGRKPLTATDITRAVAVIVAIYYLVIFFASVFYWLYRRVRVASATAERLKREKLEKENETIRFQHMFLRSQINPHFLHNTLNFFYAKALPLSQELSDGILTLSEVMRYSLQQEEDEQGTVPLEREVTHLQNVIRIHQMRFSQRLHIDFIIEGEMDGIKVIPLVFITLLENAFKHGEMLDIQHPATMRLKIDRQGGRIFFTIKNLKKSGPKESSHGIGIDNIRQRLKSSYKENYIFSINNDGRFYEVQVELPVVYENKKAAEQ